jgi:hypothetical protein
MNETPQSPHSDWVVLSKQRSRELSLSYFELKGLPFIGVFEYLPLSEFLHSLATGDHDHVLQVVVVEASLDVLDVLFVAACKDAVLSLSAVVLLGLSFLVLDVDILDVS